MGAAREAPGFPAIVLARTPLDALTMPARLAPEGMAEILRIGPGERAVDGTGGAERALLRLLETRCDQIVTARNLACRKCAECLSTGHLKALRREKRVFSDPPILCPTLSDFYHDSRQAVIGGRG